MLALMRSWISREPTARPWLVALHHRGEDYACAQLWQVKKELAAKGVLGSVLEEIPGWVDFDADTLLGAVIHAAERLAADELGEGRDA